MKSLDVVRPVVKILGRLAPAATARWAARRFLTPVRRPARDGGPVAAGAVRSTLETEQGRLAVYTWGDEGPVALLVHGWSGEAGQMTPFVPALRACGYRVVAFDAPAHGASEGRIASIVAIAAAVTAVARSVGRIEVLVAHSLGAAASARAVQRGTYVARMAWIAPFSSPRTAAAAFAAAIGLGRAARAQFFATIEAEVVAPFSQLELDAIAPDLEAPVIIVHDAADALIPMQDVARAARSLRTARLAVTQGLGHRRILGDAAVVGAAVAFVDDLREAVHDPEPVALADLDLGHEDLAAAA
jgi:pimeloyl-ACP methyl ester carboxylesterase